MNNHDSTVRKPDEFCGFRQPCASPELSHAKPSNDYEALGLEFLLHGIQSPVNIGIILRVAEAYQFKVSILDLHGVLADPAKRSTTEDFACGAMSRRDLHRLGDRSAISQLRNGRRLLATCIGHNTLPLPEFRFSSGDLIVLGNEYDGLPEEVIASADALLHVPTPAAWLPKKRSHSPIDPTRTAPVARDGEPSLNVAVTAGILCYAAYANWLQSRESRECHE